MSDQVTEARKCAQAVYLACDAEVASDIARIINGLADVLDAIPDKDDPLGWVHRVAAMMDQPHVLKLGADGWSIEHPIGCRLDGHTLHECPHHIAVAEHVDFVLDEWGEGVYRIWLDDTIWCGFDGSPDERAQIMQGETT